MERALARAGGAAGPRAASVAARWWPAGAAPPIGGRWWPAGVRAPVPYDDDHYYRTDLKHDNWQPETDVNDYRTDSMHDNLQPATDENDNLQLATDDKIDLTHDNLPLATENDNPLPATDDRTDPVRDNLPATDENDNLQPATYDRTDRTHDDLQPATDENNYRTDPKHDNLHDGGAPSTAATRTASRCSCAPASSPSSESASDGEEEEEEEEGEGETVGRMDEMYDLLCQGWTQVGELRRELSQGDYVKGLIDGAIKDWQEANVIEFRGGGRWVRVVPEMNLEEPRGRDNAG